MCIRDRFLGEEIGQPRQYSETTAAEIDEEIRSILDRAYARAVSVLEEKRDDLDTLAEELSEREELTGEEVLELIGIQRKNAEESPKK